jgi:hypothetical protein
MLYPIMPLFKVNWFLHCAIGILEGVAEATAGLSKGYFGKRSDVTGRVPFVQLGYTFSAISKPMMAVILWIFFARTIDRFGKDFELEQETPCFLMKQRHELKEKYSVFIVPWIHWALY